VPRFIAIGFLALIIGCSPNGQTEVDTTSQPHSNADTSPAFAVEPFEIASLSISQLPYARVDPVSLEDDFPPDSEGVSMYERNGTFYYHPVVLAQRGLELLASYEINADPEYLDLAARHANRLIAEADSIDGALYFPYEFDFALHGREDAVLPAPWYSAMAEGQSLSLFVRLYAEFEDEKYLDAAHKTYASFHRFRESGSEPWTVMVDDDGFLWLEEYPTDEADHHAFNGHMFAIFGLYDYFQATGEGLDELRGALTTVLHYFDRFRNPDGASFYELKYGVTDTKYHAIHIRQLKLLGDITNDVRFLEMADTLVCDLPPAPEDLAAVEC